MGRKTTGRTSRQATMITEARLRMGFSQQKVASLIGVSIGQYQRLEYGEQDIKNTSMKIGLAICVVLEIDPFILAFGEKKDLPLGRC
ncbi:MAG: helix-turn-helix transcriptional regulator [Clostridiales bacterium]|nr:helix-turn-helix transcriptional regulator [Clostridiales bacterium]